GARQTPRSPRACRLRSGRRQLSWFLLPVARPEGQRMFDFAPADLLPRQADGQSRQARIAAAVPERIVGPVPGRAARIIRIAVHRAERGEAEAAKPACMGLAFVEEGMAHAQS